MGGSPGKDKLQAHINAYDKMLLGMPGLMKMKGDYVRPHLIRKHMLALSTYSAITYGQLTMEGLRSMTPDMCQALLEVPSWLAPRKLAYQLQCKPELMSMWVCLWKDALELGGAADAVFNDAAGIRRILDVYISDHGYPPSPYVLMRKYLSVPDDVVGSTESDSDTQPAPKRRRVETGSALPSHQQPHGRCLPGSLAKAKARAKAQATVKTKSEARGLARATAKVRARGMVKTKAKAKAKGKAMLDGTAKVSVGVAARAKAKAPAGVMGCQRRQTSGPKFRRARIRTRQPKVAAASINCSVFVKPYRHCQLVLCKLCDIMICFQLLWLLGGRLILLSSCGCCPSCRAVLTCTHHILCCDLHNSARCWTFAAGR